MNKKAATETLSAVGGLIIAVLVVVALVTLIYIILPRSSTEETTVPIFYFKTLIKTIKEMPTNTIKTTQISLNKDYALVGFDKATKELNNLNEQCGKVSISGKIIKPDSCQGNGCLCICEVDTQLGSFGGGLLLQCDTEKSKCEQFNENIIGGDSCNYFLFYDYQGGLRNLEVNKKPDTIIIQAK